MRIDSLCQAGIAVFSIVTLGAFALHGAAKAAVSRAAETVGFDMMTNGQPPTGWLCTQTGPGKSQWTVVTDDSAPSKPKVLKQSGQAAYPVALRQGTELRDGFVEIKFKPVAGEEDQAGGVIWRARDADNYYIARANALENNVTIYHTAGGKRVSFKNVKTKVASNVWHRLRVEFTRDRFVVYFNGARVIDAEDDTFSEAGQVGVWTKADSVTLFDDFAYGPQ
jgi:hypothetical protein